MRYIYYIIFIILLTTIGVWAASRALMPDPAGEALLTINGRTISAAELESRQKYSPYYFNSREEFINDLITRELLIQEARKLAIDREEAFRRAMEDHYEQALIKQVLDRQFEKLAAEVTEEEVSAYIKQAGYRFQLEQLSYASPEENKAGAVMETLEIEDDFLNLPVLWQLQLLSLKEGQSCPPFPLDNGHAVLKIHKMTPLQAPTVQLPGDDIRQALHAARRQLAMERWIDGLRRGSNINMSAALRQEGGQG